KTAQHASARSDRKNLHSLAGEHIRGLSEGGPGARLTPAVPGRDKTTLRRAAPALKTRLTKLSDAVGYLDYLERDPEVPALDPDAKANLRRAADTVRDVVWKPEPIEAALNHLVEETGASKNSVFSPIRLALTGKKVALPIHDTLALLPKEDAMTRMERAAS